MPVDGLCLVCGPLVVVGSRGSMEERTEGRDGLAEDVVFLLGPWACHALCGGRGYRRGSRHGVDCCCKEQRGGTTTGRRVEVGETIAEEGAFADPKGNGSGSPDEYK